MRLREAHIRIFGALRELTVGFEPGINLVVGPNEAGKSTLLAAVRHTLLTATHQTPAQLRRTMGRYFPRPDGTVLECELVLDAGAHYRLRRRWGGEATTALTLPDGAELSGSQADERLAALLPVTAGTYATLFLVGQAQLEHTLARLREEVSSRDEVAAILREARSETGGVSVEAFERALDERFRAVFGRWDLERDRPEGGRGLDRPWSNGVGSLLRAHYNLQQARRDEQETVRAEEELERETLRLEEISSRLRTTEELVHDHASTFHALQELPRTEEDIRVQQGVLADVRAAVRRWPVIEEEITRLRVELEQAEHDASRAETDLASLSAKRREAEEIARYERARAAKTEVDEAHARLHAIDPVDGETLASLRDAERRIDELRANLSVGTLRVRVTADNPSELLVHADDEPQRRVSLVAGAEEKLEAHRRVSVTVGGVSVEMETGDEPHERSYEQLRARYEGAKADAAKLATELGVARAEDAAARAGERAAAERELRGAERRLAETLGDADWDELERRHGRRDAGVPDGPDAPGDTRDPHAAPADGGGDERSLTAALSDAKTRAGEARGALKNLEQERVSLATRYESQESLEDRLADTRTRLASLEALRDQAPQAPSGFGSVESFLTAYRRAESELPALREERHQAREAQVDLIARQPEQSADEARRQTELAEREFARIRRKADALLRVREATSAVMAEQEVDPFEPLARAVGGYLAIASDEAYAARPADDPLAPERYARSTGPELDYELLSQGTRDMVALAIRLGLAQSALPRDEAPLFLDDPLVDMDPDRRERAAAAIRAYAHPDSGDAARDGDGDRGSRQVVIFTCHPDHAKLFPGAHEIRLG